MNVTHVSWPTGETFEVIGARALIADPEAIRDTLGVYLILLPNADQILARAGLTGTNSLRKWSVLEHQHVYTGEGVAMRSRAILHLCGTIRDSAVREFLLSLQFSTGVLWSATNETLATMERRLTCWLIENAFVAFRACSFAGDVERELINHMVSPFNTKHNTQSQIISQLKVHRLSFRRHLKATGQYIHRSTMLPSAWLLRARHLAGLPMHSTKPLS